jgi:hypothetical protein
MVYLAARQWTVLESLRRFCLDTGASKDTDTTAASTVRHTLTAAHPSVVCVLQVLSHDPHTSREARYSLHDFLSMYDRIGFYQVTIFKMPLAG